MNDRKKTLIATAILISFFLFILVAIVLAITGKKIVSPLPDESSIKIIFISPTPPGMISETPAKSSTPSSTLKPSR